MIEFSDSFYSELEDVLNTKAFLNSYVKSYPALLSFFQSKGKLSREEFIQACHMVYGWMPTILEMHDRDETSIITDAFIDEVVNLLFDLKDRNPTMEEISLLSKSINNSCIGLSKFLHFMNPERYAIWDTKVSFAIYKRYWPYQVNNPENYLNYINLMQKEVNSKGCIRIYSNIVKINGFESLTKMRCVEILIFALGDQKLGDTTKDKIKKDQLINLEQ